MALGAFILIISYHTGIAAVQVKKIIPERKAIIGIWVSPVSLQSRSKMLSSYNYTFPPSPDWHETFSPLQFIFVSSKGSIYPAEMKSSLPAAI